MKKLLIVMLVLAFSSAAFAEEKVKIGFIDMQRAITEAEAGKQARADMEAMVKKKQTRIDETVAKRERLIADLEKQSVVLSEEARRQKQDELERVTREAERMISDANTELQKSQRELELELFKALDKIITELGKSGGYSLILPSDMILYYAEGSDITDTVVQKYDKIYKSKSNK